MKAEIEPPISQNTKDYPEDNEMNFAMGNMTLVS